MPLATSKIITALSTVVSVRQVVFAEMLLARRVEEIEVENLMLQVNHSRGEGHAALGSTIIQPEHTSAITYRTAAAAESWGGERFAFLGWVRLWYKSACRS